MKPRKIKYTNKEIQIIKEIYPHVSSDEVAKRLGRTVKSVYYKAKDLGVKKSEEYLSTLASGRFNKFKPFKETQFKKGHTPFNKGKKQEEYMSQDKIDKSKATRFKKGHKPHNTKHDGYQSLRSDGYLYVKIDEGVHELKQRVIWEQHNGPIPEGMSIVFKDGNRLNCKIENLEMLSRDQLMLRNTIQNYPKEYITTFKTLSKLNKKIQSYGQK